MEKSSKRAAERSLGVRLWIFAGQFFLWGSPRGVLRGLAPQAWAPQKGPQGEPSRNLFCYFFCTIRSNLDHSNHQNSKYDWYKGSNLEGLKMSNFPWFGPSAAKPVFRTQLKDKFSHGARPFIWMFRFLILSRPKGWQKKKKKCPKIPKILQKRDITAIVKLNMCTWKLHSQSTLTGYPNVNM